ncbi:SUMF1/EgtB/PvdO family nonheme iron enzyme [Chondromyces apiculatus]|uniref:Sulfatase modifying factor 2 (C-alpha-formyglycine-generating enzyme 2) n=1 Tax=Chondromyces apiculatus DSM 436 TaxID=1192034 RepID=A0A017T374_9BACT|nr:SUMF1/EgtB/PvdO family nonheme iron enzyme [Chondromyces apiculatus]EYF03442.1 Sulfatase modifying factor 2 precursor (C-alpha-formyglycine- generating enzyme 2) [Chondromyces apiculatus DSM 436]
MLDPLLCLGALSIALLTVPAAPSLDPGPSSACPEDMRLVTGAHFDEVQHLCTDPRPGSRDTHCFEYWEGLTAEEGSRTEIAVCMDQFEAPNRRGAKPFVMRSFHDAESWCAERGKRVCTEQEWELACEGPEHRPWVYGWKADRNVCNSGKGWRQFNAEKLASGGDQAEAELARLWQGALSGAYHGCVSSFGVYDLMGNVEEWVASRKRRRWTGALMGGFWAKPWTGCRGTNDAHEPKFAFYETGFRCCTPPRADTRAHSEKLP